MQSIAFAALVSVTAAISADELEFVNYAAQFNKVYEDMEEFAVRFERFVYWHRVINEHNNSNGPNFTLGHNQFDDWSNEEYAAILTLGASDSKNHVNGDYVNVFNSKDFNDSDNSDLPDQFSWVEAGGVTLVKDQGRCGACWAFSAIGALEGAYFAQYKELLEFSEQQLIDCSNQEDKYDDRNNGCKGGWMDLALTYFKDNYAMVESDYPYTSGDTGENNFNCLYSQPTSSQHKVKVTDIKQFYGDYNAEKMKALIKQQPVTIAIAANNKYIHSYANGIIDSYGCYAEELYDDEDINQVNHGVLAVGYGHDKTTGLDYWLVKNSWNTTWGDKGYFKVKIDNEDSDGICGMYALYSYYPVLD